ncbi:MAG: hypothetical protein CSB55_01240 [Candidatus Cloacimonadota bacterium]|nr:MAG: hypothetical protein CSB55_01240 [Candidatus Cloacimonadota bacterium]
MSDVYVGLVHHPVLNKFMETVTASITNLDIHDIARSCATFGVKNFFIINRLQSQKDLFQKVYDFWNTDLASGYNPDRAEAFKTLRYAFTVDDALNRIKNEDKTSPVVVATTAAERNDQVDELEIKKIIKESDNPVFLLFGTGNGLTQEILDNSDFNLKPIKSSTSYNHLSVRSAVAIYLDRLLSVK